MPAQMMEGTELAREIVSRSAVRAGEMEAATGVRPCLATVIVGDDPASVMYVRMKRTGPAGRASTRVTSACLQRALPPNW